MLAHIEQVVLVAENQPKIFPIFDKYPEKFSCQKVSSILDICSIVNCKDIDLVCINISPFSIEIPFTISKLKENCCGRKIFSILPPNMNIVMECLSRGLDDFVLENIYTDQSLECRLLKLLNFSCPYILEIKSLGNISLISQSREMYVKDTKIRLTDFEFTFLNYVIDRKGYCEIKDFKQYLCNLNGKEISKNNVVVYINRLRKKIGYQTKECLIKTRYGKGYYIDS